MNFRLAAFCAVLLTAFLHSPAPAGAQSGILLKTFELEAVKLLLDPTRPRLYALLRLSNSVAIIDTNTNSVVTTLPVGSYPEDMSISPDGMHLYVANSGSATPGVSVINLSSLTVTSSLATPFSPSSIAAGLGQRLYLASAASASYGYAGVAQVDATTGGVQGGFGQTTFQGVGLGITPDRRTLFFSANKLSSFDVSSASASALQQTTDGRNIDIEVSHNGLYLIAPTYSDSTMLIPTNDLNGIVGTFNTGSYIGTETFSADDSRVYQADSSAGTIHVFSTKTFTLLDSFRVPIPSNLRGYNPFIASMVVSEPHGYLYLALTGSSDPSVAGKIFVVSTRPAPFFDGSVALSGGFSYLQFPDGAPFGYYNFDSPPYLYHNELGFEYPVDAADGSGGIYLYDFTSKGYFYTSTSLFPYLYDFSLAAFLYYYPDTAQPGHYTANPRYFYNFRTGQIITK